MKATEWVPQRCPVVTRQATGESFGLKNGKRWEEEEGREA